MQRRLDENLRGWRRIFTLAVQGNANENFKMTALVNE
jgi:hypothetical protein